MVLLAELAELADVNDIITANGVPGLRALVLPWGCGVGFGDESDIARTLHLSNIDANVGYFSSEKINNIKSNNNSVMYTFKLNPL